MHEFVSKRMSGFVWVSNVLNREASRSVYLFPQRIKRQEFAEDRHHVTFGLSTDAVGGRFPICYFLSEETLPTEFDRCFFAWPIRKSGRQFLQGPSTSPKQLQHPPWNLVSHFNIPLGT